jgi:hypothetical protein
MLGCNAFAAARFPWAGSELLHRLRNGQWEEGVDHGQTPAEQVYALTASSPTQ